ncbi:hypothetical protein HII31_00827 [Pseudocercospora fuligena]|uniref:Uncharacterized protein n=1 Tax=Pseudocercospora fuligena TaxID=685502 RepID=A0A8H6RVN5_9PEZI|nr:hypothetical protein HII31_00827 [Pseudocercospora fuligena]
MVSSLYLLWLPIALLAVSVRSDDHLLNARNALANEISDIQAEFGENNIDTSLEGYDHEFLSTRDTNDEEPSTWDVIRDKTARILKPHHKVTRDVDEDWEPISKRDMIEHQKRALEAKHGDEFDFSLEGYDEGLLDEDEEGMEKRGEEDEEIDYSLEGYDEDLISDYLQKRDSEELPEELEEGVDYSLEGYDESLLTKRDEEEDDEEYDLPDGDGTPYDADFDSSRYLAAWDSESGIHERDFEDGDEILGTEPEGEYGPEDDEVDPNDRYYEPEEGSEVVTGAVRRDVRIEEDEDEEDEDGEDFLEVVKRWLGWE